MKQFACLSAIVFWTALGATEPAAAGSDNVRIECASAPGTADPLTLKGDVPGDHAEFELELTSRGKSRTWSDTRGHAVAVVDRLSAHGVFSAVVIAEQSPALQMFAVPGSVKSRAARPDEGEGTIAEFRAVLIVAPHPWHTGAFISENFFHDVPLHCSYDYTI